MEFTSEDGGEWEVGDEPLPNAEEAGTEGGYWLFVVSVSFEIKF